MAPVAMSYIPEAGRIGHARSIRLHLAPSRHQASKGEVDIARIVVTHKTPVLKDLDVERYTPMLAAQRYFTYAQEQLSFAAAREATGSMALFGLAKIVIANSGPSNSPEGVQVAVVRQACAQTQEPDYYANDLIEATLEVQVRNPTQDPITVHRDAFRLVTPEGIVLRTVTWGAIDPLTVNHGETGTFELRFMTRGGLECAREMKLEPDSGVTLRDRPVHIGGVSFVPSRTI